MRVLLAFLALLAAACTTPAEQARELTFQQLTADVQEATEAQPAIAAPQAAPTEHHYLTRLESVTEGGLTFWRCPGGDCLGGNVVDLRSIPQQSVVGGPPLGWAWTAYEGARDICPLGCAYQGVLASEDGVTLTNTGALSLRLGFALQATNTSDALAEILTQHGDPTGATAHKPLLGDRIILGGERWRATTLWYEDGGDPVWRDLATRVRQADYDRLKADYPGSDVPLKVAGQWLRDYGFDVRTPTQRLDGIRDPATTYDQDWTGCADSDNLDCVSGGSASDWTEVAGDADIVSNAYSQVTAGESRAEHDLSDDDVDVELTFTSLGSNNAHAIGPTALHSATVVDYYWGVTQARVGGFHRIYKRVAGSYTQLATVANSSTPPLTLRLNVVGGTSQEYFVGGSSVTSATDTAITGNLRFGVDGNGFGASGQTVDDLTACDSPYPCAVAGGGGASTHRVYINWF